MSNNKKKLQMGTSGNISTGYDHNQIGYLWSWGAGSDGKGGFGDTTNRSSPVNAGSIGSVTPETWYPSQVAGGRNMAGVRSDGSLWVWVYSSTSTSIPLGHAGDVNGTDDHQIGSATNWTSACGGYSVYHAVNSLGQLWGAGGGSGIDASVGDGGTTASSTLRQIGSLTDWGPIVGGARTKMSLKQDGTLWGWGRNAEGQLAQGSGTKSVVYSSPVQWGSATNWITVTMGSENVLAINDAGELWGCGNDYRGSLGRGAYANFISVPTRCGTGADNSQWAWVATEGRATWAVKEDGTLWGCGTNNTNQLGRAASSYRELSFAEVTGSTGGAAWIKVTTGDGNEAFGLRDDGTIWALGTSDNGNTGLGNSTGYSSITQIGSLTTWTNIFSMNHNTFAWGTHNS